MTEDEYMHVHELTHVRAARVLLSSNVRASARIPRAELDQVFLLLWKWEDAIAAAITAARESGSEPSMKETE